MTSQSTSSMTASTTNAPRFIFGWEEGAFLHNEHVILSENLLLFTCLLCCCLLMQYFIAHKWKQKYIPEAGSVILLSMLVGGIIRLAVSGSEMSGRAASAVADGDGDQSHSPYFLQFSPSLFYFGLLPPIIFSAGFLLKRQLFYDNFGVVFVMAFFGTCVSAAVISVGLYYMINYTSILQHVGKFTLMECIAFGFIISSTDPVTTLSVFTSLKVDPSLYYAVLGESILNDAVAITGFRVAVRFIQNDLSSTDVMFCMPNFVVIVVASTVIGYVFGIILAFLFKHVDFEFNRIIPVSIFLGVVYIPFLLAEVLQLSGILAMFFAGISARRYIYKNLNAEVRILAAFAFQLIAHISDTMCFALLGLSVFFLDFNFTQSYQFFLLLILLTWASRAVAVYPLLSMVNVFRFYRRPATPSTNRYSPISINTMHMIFFAGLRGSVAFALSYLFPDDYGHRNIIMCSATVVILVTIFIQGGLTEEAIRALGIPTNIDMGQYLKSHQGSSEMFDFEKKYIYPYILKSNRPTPTMTHYSTIPSMREGDPSQLPFDIMNDGSITSPSFKAIAAPIPADEDEQAQLERSDALQYHYTTNNNNRHRTLSSGGGTVIGFEEAQSMRREAMTLSYRDAEMERVSSWSSIRRVGPISASSHATSGNLEGVLSNDKEFSDTKHNAD